MSAREISPAVDKNSVYAHAREIFGNPKKMQSWMNTPNRIFNGMKPKDFIEYASDEDLQLIANELDRIDQGVF